MICLYFATFFVVQFEVEAVALSLHFLRKLELFYLVSNSCFEYLNLVKQQLVP